MNDVESVLSTSTDRAFYREDSACALVNPQSLHNATNFVGDTLGEDKIVGLKNSGSQLYAHKAIY